MVGLSRILGICIYWLALCMGPFSSRCTQPVEEWIYLISGPIETSQPEFVFLQTYYIRPSPQACQQQTSAHSPLARGQALHVESEDS